VSVIVEHALLEIRDDKTEEFQAAFADARTIISAMAGFRSLTLSRCIERGHVFLLLVEWDRLEDHTVGFRESPEYRRWSQLLHRFYEPFPLVEHFERADTV
jgi:heme-degrading monooxygenase HmoA